MKRLIILSGCFVAAVIVACVVYALDVRSSNAITFTSSYTLTIGNSHPNPFKLNSVVMSFASIQTNTFDIYLTRQGGSIPQHIWSSEQGAYQTASWVPEGRGYNIKVGDVLFFTNSVAVQAELVYFYEL